MADKAPARDEELLQEIRDRYTAADTQWNPIREEGREDVRYVAGRVWTAEEKAKRGDRPSLSFDELGQHVNALNNDVRLNKRAIRVSPRGSELGDQAERFAVERAALIRQIEYQSNAAQQAYVTMFESAVQRSFGWLRIVSRYVSPKSWDMELAIVEIPNPDLVLPDPEHQMADGSDLSYLFLHESYLVSEFTRKYKDVASITAFDGPGTDSVKGWLKGDKITVAEYWKKKTVERVLLRIRTAKGEEYDVFQDELTKDANPQIIKKRAVEDTQVWQYLTNGYELLGEPRRWPGKDIPFVPCYGKVLFVTDGGRTERLILSLPRLARDPIKYYCYLRSTQAELVGRTPKVPAVGYEGQFEGHEDDWEEAQHTPKPFLEAKATVAGLPPGAILPLPVSNPYDAAPIERLEIACEAARLAIQAAVGTTPLPTQAQRRNEKSGVALKQIEEAGQKGSFHFIDHYEASIRRTGEILNDCIPHFYDTARTVTVRKPDDQTRQVRINDPEWVDPDTQEPTMISMVDGEFDVTIGTGPSLDSEREAQSEFADLLLQTPFANMVADLAVRLKNPGPLGEEIADRLIPPQFRKPKDGKPDPVLQQQQLAQAKDTIDALTTQLQGLAEQLKTDAIKGQVQIAITKMNNAARIRIAEMSARLKGIELKLGQEFEAEQAAIEREFNAEMAAAQQQADVSMARLGHAQTMQQGAQQHQQALEQGAAGHQQQLEAAEQQAALQPPPEAGA